MLSASLRPEMEIGQFNPIPSRITLSSYQNVIAKIPIFRALFNSLLVASTVTAGVLLFGSMIGYALARLQFRGRDVIFMLILFTMVLPFQITLIPMYILMVKFGWNDSFLALIVPYLINAYSIVLFRQYFKSVPADLVDAARIDGCSEYRILFAIFWPLSIPAMITVGILTFMSTWNEVLWPMIVIRKWELMTMPQLVALFATGGKAEGQLGTQLAAATFMALPIILAYLFFQRYFIASMASTGLKS
jgi:ABC-type glycerol-3-phosphate transport system permease component